MARTTVEDCLKVCPNHFELTLLATWRARKMAMSGDRGLVESDNDKPIVVALREIRNGLHQAPEHEEEAEDAAAHGEEASKESTEGKEASDPGETEEEAAG